MNKVMIVAAREFVETVRTRAFMLSSVFLPLVIVGLIFGAEKLQAYTEQSEIPPRKLALVDETGLLADRLAAAIAAFNEQNPNRKLELIPVAGDDATEETLAAAVENDTYYAYLRIGPDAIDGDSGVVLGRKDSQLQARRELTNLVRNVVVALRFERADPAVDMQLVARIQRDVPFSLIDVGTGAETQGNEMARFMTPFAFMFLLFMGTFGISQGLLTSLIEEKSTRVIEVLLAAVSPLQLMAGKIVGMVGVGLLLLAIWGGLGYASARYQDMAYLVNSSTLVYAALYFLPAFLLFSGILGGIGAACNTLKEAQSMTFPVSIITIIPMMLWFQITENPASILSLVLSFIPPITPFVMILRICADPSTPLWQIILTQILLWASAVGAIWASAKIFRVGVLMYGKPPTPLELLRWIRRA